MSIDASQVVLSLIIVSTAFPTPERTFYTVTFANAILFDSF